MLPCYCESIYIIYLLTFIHYFFLWMYDHWCILSAFISALIKPMFLTCTELICFLLIPQQECWEKFKKYLDLVQSYTYNKFFLCLWTQKQNQLKKHVENAKNLVLCFNAGEIFHNHWKTKVFCCLSHDGACLHC